MRLVLAAGAVVLVGSAFAFADGDAGPRSRLYGDLAAEALAVREQAARTLERDDAVTEAEVGAALRRADVRAKPYLLRLAAARKMTGLVPDVVANLAGDDPVVSEAAVRALVLLGDEAVQAGLGALGARKDQGSAAARGHLVALSAQLAVEREVVSKWRRKGGSYEGRYKGLAKYGWPVQPVLLAMLLDVPLSDHHVVLPETDDPNVLQAARMLALIDIENSNRRGYATIEPLPLRIEAEELFDLAAQALKDVADIDLLGEILESISEDLQQADENAGFRLRPVERYYSRDIDVVLFNRGRPERLQRLTAKLADDVSMARRFAERRRDAESKNYLSEMLSEYANALHQVHLYEESAEAFAEVIRIGKGIGGKEPAIAGYNRACALARAGLKEEAMRQLTICLDRDRSAGSEDLTEEWVTEDGDLETLRDDPRYAALIKKRFGG